METGVWWIPGEVIDIEQETLSNPERTVFVIKRWLTAEEAAREAGVSPDTIERWARDGVLRSKIGASRHLRVSPPIGMDADRRLWADIVSALVRRYGETGLTQMLREWQATATGYSQESLQADYRDTTVRRWARGERLPRVKERRWLWREHIRLGRGDR